MHFNNTQIEQSLIQKSEIWKCSKLCAQEVWGFATFWISGSAIWVAQLDNEYLYRYSHIPKPRKPGTHVGYCILGLVSIISPSYTSVLIPYTPTGLVPTCSSEWEKVLPWSASPQEVLNRAHAHQAHGGMPPLAGDWHLEGLRMYSFCLLPAKVPTSTFHKRSLQCHHNATGK